jgi:hypothetical protein
MRNHGSLHGLPWRECGHVLRLLDVAERWGMGPEVSLYYGLSAPIPDHEWCGSVVRCLLQGGSQDANPHDP